MNEHSGRGHGIMSEVNAAKALEFLQRNGDPAFCTLAQYALQQIPLETALQAIQPYQREDGGWARIDKDLEGDLSMISQTWLGLQWLIYLRPGGPENLRRTVDFLVRAQHPAGCWDEPQAVLAYNPPPWMLPGQYANQLWLTSAVCCKLSELDLLDRVRFDAALSFLRGGWRGDHFPNSAHPHWMVMPLLYRTGPQNALDGEIMAGCRTFLWNGLTNHQIDPLDVTSVAYAAHLCGDFAADLFKLALDRMLSLQQPDGGWTTNYGDQHRPGATLDALFLLRRTGHLA
jgi:hypothetical protein